MSMNLNGIPGGNIFALAQGKLPGLDESKETVLVIDKEREKSKNNLHLSRISRLSIDINSQIIKENCNINNTTTEDNVNPDEILSDEALIAIGYTKQDIEDFDHFSGYVKYLKEIHPDISRQIARSTKQEDKALKSKNFHAFFAVMKENSVISLGQFQQRMCQQLGLKPEDYTGDMYRSMQQDFVSSAFDLEKSNSTLEVYGRLINKSVKQNLKTIPKEILEQACETVFENELSDEEKDFKVLLLQKLVESCSLSCFTFSVNELINKNNWISTSLENKHRIFVFKAMYDALQTIIANPDKYLKSKPDSLLKEQLRNLPEKVIIQSNQNKNDIVDESQESILIDEFSVSSEVDMETQFSDLCEHIHEIHLAIEEFIICCGEYLKSDSKLSEDEKRASLDKFEVIVRGLTDQVVIRGNGELDPAEFKKIMKNNKNIEINDTDLKDASELFFKVAGLKNVDFRMALAMFEQCIEIMKADPAITQTVTAKFAPYADKGYRLSGKSVKTIKEEIEEIDKIYKETFNEISNNINPVELRIDNKKLIECMYCDFMKENVDDNGEIQERSDIFQEFNWMRMTRILDVIKRIDEIEIEIEDYREENIINNGKYVDQDIVEHRPESSQNNLSITSPIRIKKAMHFNSGTHGSQMYYSFCSKVFSGSISMNMQPEKPFGGGLEDAINVLISESEEKQVQAAKQVAIWVKNPTKELEEKYDILCDVFFSLAYHENDEVKEVAFSELLDLLYHPNREVCDIALDALGQCMGFYEKYDQPSAIRAGLYAGFLAKLDEPRVEPILKNLVSNRKSEKKGNDRKNERINKAESARAQCHKVLKPLINDGFGNFDLLVDDGRLLSARETELLAKDDAANIEKSEEVRLSRAPYVGMVELPSDYENKSSKAKEKKSKYDEIWPTILKMRDEYGTHFSFDVFDSVNRTYLTCCVQYGDYSFYHCKTLSESMAVFVQDVKKEKKCKEVVDLSEKLKNKDGNVPVLLQNMGLGYLYAQYAADVTIRDEFDDWLSVHGVSKARKQRLKAIQLLALELERERRVQIEGERQQQAQLERERLALRQQELQAQLERDKKEKEKENQNRNEDISNKVIEQIE